MHGIIFSELKKYVDAKLGGSAWNDLLAESGIGSKLYLAIQAYPDEEVLRIVTAASRKTSTPVPAILEDFGEFIAPDLLGMYRTLVRKDWRTLDILEHTEETIHRVVRLQHADSTPPYLTARRIGPDEVTVVYTSPRKLCAIAKGIIRGLSVHFGEVVLIEERRCMHRGETDCLISVKRVARGTI